MRTSLSLFVSTLVFGSLTINCPVVNSSSFVGLSSADSQQLLSSTDPENPTPYRGGGRREDLIKSNNIRFNA